MNARGGATAAGFERVAVTNVLADPIGRSRLWITVARPRVVATPF